MSNTSTPVKYFSVLVPFVGFSHKGHSRWHPTTGCGPFSTLCRGAFATRKEAHAWAKANIPGSPYTVKAYA